MTRWAQMKVKYFSIIILQDTRKVGMLCDYGVE